MCTGCVEAEPPSAASHARCQLAHCIAVVVGACQQLSSDNFHAQFVADPYVQRPSLSIPTNITTGQPAQCDKLEEFSVLDGGVSHHGLAIQRRILRQERRLTAARPCVFVGGLGLKSNGNPTTSVRCFARVRCGAAVRLNPAPRLQDNAYWGSTLKATLASQCSSFAFVQRDMRGKGWDDVSLPRPPSAAGGVAVTNGQLAASERTRDRILLGCWRGCWWHHLQHVGVQPRLGVTGCC